MAESNPIASLPIMDLLGETTLTTITLSPSVSYRVNTNLSLGLGLDLVYGEGTITRKNHSPFPLPDAADVDADGFGVGGIVGFVYEFNENHRIGASYRYSPKVDADGDNKVAGQTYDTVSVPLPDIFQFAGYHKLTDKFAVSYTAQWTEWSAFDTIDLSDGHNGAPDTYLKEYYWDDSWLFSIGLTYYLNETWTLRCGFMHDKAVTDQLESISIPDSDRNWYTAGVTYNFNPRNSIDFGIAYIKAKKTDVTEYSNIPGSNNPVTAQTQSGAIYYSISYNHAF